MPPVSGGGDGGGASLKNCSLFWILPFHENHNSIKYIMLNELYTEINKSVIAPF